VELASLSELFETDALHTTMVAIGPDVVPAARHDLTVSPKKPFLALESKLPDH
jgi:hypothetical protein